MSPYYVQVYQPISTDILCQHLERLAVLDFLLDSLEPTYVIYIFSAYITLSACVKKSVHLEIKIFLANLSN